MPLNIKRKRVNGDMFSFYEIKEIIIESVTNIALFIIKKTNKYKNRCLSQRLYEVAEEYNTRPNENNYNEVNYMRKMSEKCLEHLDDLIFLVKNESDSQINKCGITKCTPAEWVTYLIKEVGEVAKAIS